MSIGPLGKRVVKQYIKAITPQFVLLARRRFLNYRLQKRFSTLSLSDTFTAIYKEQLWGSSASSHRQFFSGTGSHDANIADLYVEEVRRFLSGFQSKLSVVDLGCGDFCIGARIRPYCARYIACDIVAPLIGENQRLYGSLNVDFRVLNVVEDDLPSADVVIIRQVLQHLSNDQITEAVEKIRRRFRYAIVTEHLPMNPGFVANVDKPAGPDVRPFYGSGVVLTKSPFDLEVEEDVILCESVELGATIRTNLYRLPLSSASR